MDFVAPLSPQLSALSTRLLREFNTLGDTEKAALVPQLCALACTDAAPRLRGPAARALSSVPGAAVANNASVRAAVQRLENDLQRSPSALLRSTALEALVALCGPSAVSALAGRLLRDISPRVRRTAVRLCCHGAAADFGVLCGMLLSDPDPGVRSALVDAIFDVLHVPREEAASSESAGPSVEAAFTHFSAAVVLDTSTEVRTKACACMGRLRGVPEALLIGSLTKWPPGAAKDLGVSEAVPSRTIDLSKLRDPDIRITSLGAMAAGAFAHAAEDEFFVVREAAIESLQQLSAECRAFSDAALGLLTDMLNDPIDQVRVRAICALGRVSARSTLMDEQLRTVLSVLDEASPQVRLAVHGLLASAHVTGPAAAVLAVNSLMQSIRSFEENDSAFATLRAFGWNNAELFADAVGELLGLDPRFAPVERLITDIDYMGRAIAVLNAAYRCPEKVVPMLPEFVVVHSVSFHEKYPSFFPGTLSTATAAAVGPVGLLGGANGISSNNIISSGSSGYDLGEFMGKALRVVYTEVPRLYAAGRVRECMTLLHECSRDVHRVAKLTHGAGAEFHYSYLARIREFMEIACRNSNGGDNSGSVAQKAQTLIEQSYSMEHIRFVGLPQSASLQLRLMRCAAHLALVIADAEDAEEAKRFGERVRALERMGAGGNSGRLFSEVAMMAVTATTATTTGSEGLNADREFADKVKALQRQYIPEDPQVGNGLRRVYAKIVYPEAQGSGCNSSCTPAEYQSDLPLLLHVRFRVSRSAEHLLGTISLAVRVGESTQLWPVKKQHVVGTEPEDAGNCVLVDVPLRIVCMQAHSEPLAAEITVVRTFEPDIESDMSALPLSKPLFYYIKPKKLSIFN